MFGYAGKILHVDLTNGTIEIEEPAEELYRTYLGGSALGMYYLLKSTPAGADPLGPDNTMAFMLSGVTGAPVAGQSRCTVVAKSPLTGAVGDHVAVELRQRPGGGSTQSRGGTGDQRRRGEETA